MNLKEQLIEKMEAEFEHFHSWLLEQPPEEILDLAYDYLTKQDIRTHCLLFPEPQISLFGKMSTSLPQMVLSVRLSSATTRFVSSGSSPRSLHSTEA